MSRACKCDMLVPTIGSAQLGLIYALLARVILDLSSEVREKMTVEDLMRMYSQRGSHQIDDNRTLSAD